MGDTGETGSEALRRAFEAADDSGGDAGGASEESIQVLTFSLADEWYGFRLEDLVEILGGAETTPVPYTPDFIPGLINHRGTVVAVVDLKRVFGLAGRYRHQDSRVVLVAAEGVTVGFQADEISDVVTVARSAIEPPLSTIEKVKADFIEGCIRLDRGLLVLLDSRALILELKAEGKG